MKKTSFKTSSRAMTNSVPGTHQVSQSSRHKWSFTGSQISRISLLGGRSNRKHILDRSKNQANKRVQVLDHDGNDVTPVPLYDAVQGDMQSNPGLDELFSSSSESLKSSSSFNLLTSSIPPPCHPPCGSTISSLNNEVKDSLPKLDVPINLLSPSEVPMKIDNVKRHIVTEEMLDEEVGMWLTETDTILLLDIPPTFISEGADDAEAIKESNIKYAELCKKRMGNDKGLVRSTTQTLSGALKNKLIQTDKIFMVDEGTVATNWDIYDSFCGQSETPDKEKADDPGSIVNTTKGQEKSSCSSSSTICTGSTISTLSEAEVSGNTLNAESDPQLILLSDSFQHSLLVMERSIVTNILQPKLAAYRQLPVLEDPDSTVKPGADEQSEEGEESSSSPTLKRLWAFSCELTRGCNITSMTWNKENPDLLAVGYGDYDCKNQKPGFICCWSLKNPTWPERVFHCHSCVTSLDFSANNPSQLAVGMLDGTIAIYNVWSQDSIGSCIANSSACSKKHQRPVWQVNWTKQKMISSEHSVETLVSVSADGRITKWLLSSNGLDCIDLMKLKETQHRQKKAGDNKANTQDIFSVTPGLCVDFQPRDSRIYLVGTWEGVIHKCSVISQHLDTYKKHIFPVNHIEWSPFSSDVFLSCSSDGTIQLWRQDSAAPVLSFTSTQMCTPVYAARWSPNRSTVFAAISKRQVEIWDLNSSILHPTIVHHSGAGVKVTSLLFARGTDCVLVGDSDGQVNVYQLKNLSVGEGKQVKSLEDIIRFAA